LMQGGACVQCPHERLIPREVFEADEARRRARRARSDDSPLHRHPPRPPLLANANLRILQIRMRSLLMTQVAGTMIIRYLAARFVNAVTSKTPDVLTPIT